MNKTRIALFGETEKGNPSTAYVCDRLDQLVDLLGNPPEGSSGLHCAIQALLSKYPLIFFHVEEEGFSPDYFHGLNLIKKKKLLSGIGAFCLPGVGDKNIIDPFAKLCVKHRQVLIMHERDLYDYLTHTTA